MLEDRTAPAGIVPVPGDNVNLGRLVDNQAEATIAVDPTNTQRLFAASMTFHGSENGFFFDPNINLPNINNPELVDLRSRTLGMYGSFSINAGANWVGRRLFTGGPTGAGENSLPAARADPQVVFDSRGNLFMTYLSTIHQFGTASGGSVTTLEDSTRHWTRGMWEGSWITAYHNVAGQVIAEHRMIVGNTQNTITVNGTWRIPNANTTYVIYAGMLRNQNGIPVTDKGGAVVLVRSTDGGQTFQFVKFLDRGATPGVDFPALAVGPGRNADESSVWVVWRPSPSITNNNQLVYNPLLANGAPVTAQGVGDFYDTPVQIPNSAGGNLASAAVGPNGELMVSFQQFEAQGANNPPPNVPIFVSVDANGLNAGGWGNPIQVATTNIVNPQQTPLPITASPRNGITPRVQVAWDRTARQFTNNATRAYLVYTTSPNALNRNTNRPWNPNPFVPNGPPNNNDTDIHIMYSDNAGANWLAPPNNGRIHAPSNLAQFMPALEVDQVTGYVAVAYLDTDPNNNNRVRTVVSLSSDGGQQWLPGLVPVSRGVSEARQSNQWMRGTLAAANGNAANPIVNLNVNNANHVNWPVNYWANSRWVVQLNGNLGEWSPITGNQANQLTIAPRQGNVPANTPFEIRPRQTKMFELRNNQGQVVARRPAFVSRSYSFDYGDYIDMAFHNGVMHPIWPDNSNSTRDNPNGARNTLDLYTSRVTTFNLNNFFPRAWHDFFQVFRGQTLNVPAPGVLGNDTDEENDPLTAVLVNGPGNAASFQFNADGSFTYQPAAGFLGTDSFSYKANDGNGDSNVVDVLIQVNDSTPRALPDYFAAAAGQILQVPAPGVLDNDEDDAGNALSAALVSGPGNAASFQFNSDGSFSYTPASGFVGVDSFTYKVNNGTNDSDPTTVQITVNNAPQAQADSYSTSEGQTLAVAATGVLANDTDPDGDALAVSAINGDGAGLGHFVILPSGGEVTLQSDGSFNYRPPAGFVGQDSFEYSTTDGVDSSTATVSIDIQASAQIGNFVWVDLDGDGIRDNVEYGYSGLSVELYNSSGNMIASTTTASDGSYGFSNVAPGDYYLVFERPEHYAFTLQDQGTDDTIDSDADENGVTALFTLLANQNRSDLDAGLAFVNQVPVAVDDGYSVVHDRTLTTSATGPEYPVVFNDFDPDGDSLTVVEVQASDGSTGSVGSAFTLPSGAIVNMQSDGNFTYTPPANWTGQDSFTYTLYDGFDIAAASVTIMVTNQAPVANSDLYSTAQGQPLTITAIDGLLANDDDPDDDWIWIAKVNGSSANVGTQITTAAGGTLTVNADGSFTYEPPAGFTGVDSFTYELTDGLENALTTVYLEVV